jgi:hypothetical protein
MKYVKLWIILKSLNLLYFDWQEIVNDWRLVTVTTSLGIIYLLTELKYLCLLHVPPAGMSNSSAAFQIVFIYLLLFLTVIRFNFLNSTDTRASAMGTEWVYYEIKKRNFKNYVQIGEPSF